MTNKIRIYAISIAISLGVGVASALLTRNDMEIYNRVETPLLSPPSILFPVVWTILYILMGISAAMIFTTKTTLLHKRKEALYVYALSLLFNFLWSVIFFSFNAYFLAFVWLVALLFLIILTIFRYKKINEKAAILQIPYAVWVTFAGYLNAGIWILNR